MKIKKHTTKILGSLVLVLGIGFVFFSGFNLSKSKKRVKQEITTPIVSAPLPAPKLFGLATDSFEIARKTIQRNEVLSTILGSYQIDQSTVTELAKKSKPIFNVRKITTGKPYTIFTYKNRPEKIAYFVYQPNAVDYVVYDLRDTLGVHSGKKEVSAKTENIAGEIKNSLYEALQEQGADPSLALKLAEIYGWAVDFYAIEKGDWFKIQYERQYVDNEAIDAGRIKAAVFSHKGKELQAYYFQPADEEKGSYYDEHGNGIKRDFLKAPLKFSQITSRFSGRRLHPVQKIWKAHLGTDYAAPTGTPIIATGSGVVIASSYTGGNGNFVKIKHNNTYSTQYLHMSRRAVRMGQRVQQGQVIGYVGSTGLATGPHVCYRFWKNGKQVDALRQNFQESIALDKKYLAVFLHTIQPQQQQLASLSVKEHESLTAANDTEQAEEETAL